MKAVFAIAMIFLLWVSFVSLSSAWIGYWNLFPVPLLVLGLAAAFLLWKRFGFEAETPALAVGLFVLMLALSAFPLLLVHPFFPASADALHVTHIRILQDHIPATYSPYADLQFTYQIGFALFSNAIAKTLFLVPDYLVVWLLGLLFSGLLVLLSYWIVFELTQNPKTGLVAGVLVFGSKFVFQTFYYGVFPLLASFCLFLAAWLLLEKKNPLVFLLVPAVLIFHPFTGLLLLFFLACYFAQNRNWRQSFWVLVSVLLALPSFLTTYWNAFGNASNKPLSFGFSAFFSALAPVPLWLGLVPLLFFLLAVAFLKRTKKTRFVLFFSLAVFALFLFFAGIGFPHADKFFTFFSIFAVLFASLFFVSGFWQQAEQKNHLARRFNAVLLVLLLLCLASFFLSKDLQHARSGSKATVADEQFAFAFKQFDPSLKKTIFLSQGSGGWLAVLSNKIPLDPLANNMIQGSELQFAPGWSTVLARSELQKRIENGCLDCIAQSGSDYLAVDRNLYGFQFTFKKVFEFGSFEVYTING